MDSVDLGEKSSLIKHKHDFSILYYIKMGFAYLEMFAEFDFVLAW